MVIRQFIFCVAINLFKPLFYLILMAVHTCTILLKLKTVIKIYNTHIIYLTNSWLDAASSYQSCIQTILLNKTWFGTVYLYQGTLYLYLELIFFGIMCKQGIIIHWCKWCTILYLFCCQFWENVGGVIFSVYFKGFSAILWLSGCSGEIYSIQHYVIKFVNDLRQVAFGGFLLVLRFPPPIKLTATI